MGADLLVIVPTRSRPGAIAELTEAFRNTCTSDTRLVAAVDQTDPELPAYSAIVRSAANIDLWVNQGTPTMVGALNSAAAFFLKTAFPYAVGFMGDDHRPRTKGWDRSYLETLREMGTGLVYGNDLLQGERIPTQVAMTADIPRALGHIAPTRLTHLFVDNYWRDLGKGANCIRYLPDVIVEHVHPFAGKAAMDEGYHRVNARTMYQQDAAAYAEYIGKDYAHGHLLSDIEKVQELRK